MVWPFPTCTFILPFSFLMKQTSHLLYQVIFYASGSRAPPDSSSLNYCLFFNTQLKHCLLQDPLSIEWLKNPVLWSSRAFCSSSSKTSSHYIEAISSPVYFCSVNLKHYKISSFFNQQNRVYLGAAKNCNPRHAFTANHMHVRFSKGEEKGKWERLL